MSGVKDKHVEVNGKVIGGESLIRLNVKTALWLIAGIFSVVMTILTWSYVDLKNDVKAAEAEANKARKEFIQKVEDKTYDMGESVHRIEVSVEKTSTNVEQIQKDIDRILDRQVRDNPVVPNPNLTVDGTNPPG